MIDSYGDRVVYLMRMVSSALARHLDAELREHGLNRAQWGALSALALEHPTALTGAALSRRSGVTAQSMHSAVTTLIERGMITSSSTPDHGRTLDLHITAAGVRMVETLQPRLRELEQRALRSLTGRQAADLRHSLRLMMDDLDMYVPDTRQ